MNDILSINHWTMNYFKQRVTTKQLKQIFLQYGDWVLKNGCKYVIRSRKLGAGVNEIWLEESSE